MREELDALEIICNQVENEKVKEEEARERRLMHV